MNRDKLLLLVLFIAMVVAGTAFSQNTVVVRRVVGKVEIQRPGEA